MPAFQMAPTWPFISSVPPAMTSLPGLAWSPRDATTWELVVTEVETRRAPSEMTVSPR